MSDDPQTNSNPGREGNLIVAAPAVSTALVLYTHEPGPSEKKAADPPNPAESSSPLPFPGELLVFIYPTYRVPIEPISSYYERLRNSELRYTT